MKHSKLIIALLVLAVFAGCKKDAKVNINTFKVVKEKIVADALSVRVEGTYDYAGRINSIDMKIGKKADLSDAENYRTIVNGEDFNVTVTGLQPVEEYFYCYEVDYGSTTTYLTEVKTFNTEDYLLPVVNTLEVDQILENRAEGHGEVVTDGGGDQISVRGLCWGLSHNPTISDFYVNAGTGLGAFDCVMSELQANQTYYVRAYAGNSKGIAYGNEVSFTTQPLGSLPTVSTDAATSLNVNSILVEATVADEGADAVIVRGICWSVMPHPEMDGDHESCGSGAGSFSCTVSGLSANTTYYVRAYAMNSVGVAYGNEVSVTLQSEITLPTVVTNEVMSIMDDMATGGGNVIDDGGSTVTERGICWSTYANPTVDDNRVPSGSGTGMFSCQMTGLESNTSYYVRAYAVNALGIAYGNEVMFIIPSKKH